MSNKKVSKEKDITTAVLVHIPNDLYEPYIESVFDRGLKRQHHSAKIFCDAIRKDLDEYNNSIKGVKS